jgi:hypothetical protein
MWSRFRGLSLSTRLYFGLVAILMIAFALTWWSVRQAEAAPCNPLVCVPMPTLPPPQPSGFPQAFQTPTPPPTANPSPNPSPTALPGPPGPLQLGQDVGVTALAQASAGAAGGMAKHLDSQLNAPNISGDWFRPLYDRMTTIALWVLVFCLILAAVQYVISRQFGQVMGAWFGWAPGSIAITALGITVTNLLLAITDALCAYMLGGIAGDVPGFLLHLSLVLGAVGAGTALAGVMLPVAGFLAAFVLVAILGIFVELLIRQVVMYVNLLWLPFVAVSATWAPARNWLYRLAKLQFVVIFAKFAVVVVLALGVAAFAAHPAAMGDLGDPNLVAILMGLVVLAVALASPYLLLRLLPHDFEHAASELSRIGNKKAVKFVRRQITRGAKGLATKRAGGTSAVPIASKAGAAVVPIQLVIRGGRVVAARGGQALKKGAAQPRRKRETPAGDRVTPTSSSTGRTNPAPGPSGRRPPPSYPSPPPKGS